MKNKPHTGITIFLILLLGQMCLSNARGQKNELERLFEQAQKDQRLRVHFIDFYIQQVGLPEHVMRILYSEEVDELAFTNPLVKTKGNNYLPTSHALAIGRGYPSSITFGPKMFHPAHRYADFLSVIQHEAAHAKFWATGKLNHMHRVETGKDSAVRLRGILPILFELDALETQMKHPGWERTSTPFKKAQEAYRQKWLNKLAGLEKQSYMYDMKPLLESIRRTYEKP